MRYTYRPVAKREEAGRYSTGWHHVNVGDVVRKYRFQQVIFIHADDTLWRDVILLVCRSVATLQYRLKTRWQSASRWLAQVELGSYVRRNMTYRYAFVDSYALKALLPLSSRVHWYFVSRCSRSRQAPVNFDSKRLMDFGQTGRCVHDPIMRCSASFCARLASCLPLKQLGDLKRKLWASSGHECRTACS